METLHEKLAYIQQRLNAPKDAYNGFAKYYYRSAESILAAAKPLLKETGLVLTLSDTVEQCGERVYIKATAELSDGKEIKAVTALAREPESKKGADDSQITGAASSYARKYALCGLFAIDDNKDADATNTHGKAEPSGIDLKAALAELHNAADLNSLKAVFGELWKHADNAQRVQLKDKYGQRKADFLAAQNP